MFGKRFVMHAGDSTKTVPAWTRDAPRRCDMLFVDGDHSAKGARIDMVNMRQAAAPGAIAIADDINSDPGLALEALAKDGQIEVVESYGPFEAPSPHNPCMRTNKRGPYCSAWGFAVYTYPNATASQGRLARSRSARLPGARGGTAERRDKPPRGNSGDKTTGGTGGSARQRAKDMAMATGMLSDGTEQQQQQQQPWRQQ